MPPSVIAAPHQIGRRPSELSSFRPAHAKQSGAGIRFPPRPPLHVSAVNAGLNLIDSDRLAKSLHLAGGLTLHFTVKPTWVEPCAELDVPDTVTVYAPVGMTNCPALALQPTIVTHRQSKSAQGNALRAQPFPSSERRRGQQG